MKTGRSFYRRRSGFTVVELLIVLAVTLILTLIMLQLFNLSDRLARVQTRVSEMQQSLRIGQYDMVRLARMAGRGGLPSIQAGTALPSGIAVSVRGNVSGTGARLTPGDAGTPKLLEGTDVITLRGAFSTQIFQLNSLDKRTFRRWDDGANPAGGGSDADPATTTNGEFQLCAVSPAGIAQPLAPFQALIDDASTNPSGASLEALVLVSPLDPAFYTVVQMDPIHSTKTATTCAIGIEGVTIKYLTNDDARSVAYRALQPPGAFRMPPQLTSAIYVGIIEEYRYYVREDRADPTDPASDLVPVLTRARFYPGTEVAYQNNASNLTVDIASGIVDLQASYGIDTNNDGQVIEGLAVADRPNDEWLGNARIANAANAPPENPIAGKLAYLRISTLARTERRDPDYVAPVLDRSEDHSYAFDVPDRTNGRTDRMYRRRQLQTIVDLRNLS
ncbi:MAG TPA: PilW family protein [Thermoanaerobaculia bacterium]|nr:PilW family protein [Thermoanaerobaculia bacterium]